MFMTPVYDTLDVTSKTGIISAIAAISGGKIIDTIKVAFTNIQSKIKINGLLSDLFTLK